MSDGVALGCIALVAAVVNGVLGHGFSSIMMPVALLFTTGRALNPAIVLVEVVINGSLLVASRRRVRPVLGRVWPVVVGLGPGIAVGAYLLSVVDPTWLRLLVFAALLPLILLQAAGVRRAVGAERAVGGPVGAAVGVLYSLTTISGPPLALTFNNQGLAKHDFRAALAVVRLAESTLTAVAYGVLGLYSTTTVGVLATILPGVLLGLPLGALVIGRLEVETFRRVCMSFDAWIVGFGVSRALLDRVPAVAVLAHGIWLTAIAIDGWLLLRFFGGRRSSRLLLATGRPVGP